MDAVSLSSPLFTSSAADSPDSTVLRPSDWNEVTGLLTALLGTTAGVYLHETGGPGIHIKGGSTSDSRASIVFENSAGLIRAAFNPEGQYYTNGWMTISGGFSVTQDVNGNITNFTSGSSGLTTMLDVISDIIGPTIVAKSTNTGYNFQGLDVNGNYTFSVGSDGALQWGVGATFASMDTFLSRLAAGSLGITTSNAGNSTATYGLTLQNTTAASAGSQVQNAPVLRFTGNAWNTTSLVSEQDTWEICNSVTAGNPSTSLLSFFRRIAGGVPTSQFSVSSAGNATLGGSLDMVNGNLTIWASGELRHNGRTRFGSSGTGLFYLQNNAATAGVGLDVTTDGTLKVRVTAQNADGSLAAKSVRGTAVAFASLPSSPVEGMLVAVTDSTTATWGATITGSGANHVLAYYNGTNWTVAGK